MSTIDAIIDFTADVLPSLDKREQCIAVYLDLSKAFDTINHGILLNKLEYYGIRGKVLVWFKSYLFQRRQYVEYKGVQSEIKHTEYGVPQGSVLGPLLFIIYSNDLPHSLQHCETILFADDTTLYFTHPNMQTLYMSVNSDLSTLDDWFRANQLSVNPTKTKYILFAKRPNLTDECSLFINDERLEKVKSTKFLGLHIDECFSWETHIGYCKSKIASGIHAINTSKHILSERNLKTLYYSLVHAHLLYGIQLWGNAYHKYIGKLEIAQRKAIRAVGNARYNEAYSPIFTTKHIKLKDLYNIHVRLFVYQFVNVLLPVSLLKVYKYHGDEHEHNTRHSTHPRCPIVNIEIMHISFLYTGPHLWMSLNDHIQSSRTKTTFKRRITQNYIKEY